MAKFLQRGDEVEAFRWTGGPDQTDDPVPVWIVDAIRRGDVFFVKSELGAPLMIIANNADDSIGRGGDWIVRWPSGRIVAYRPADFAALFMSSEETAG